MNNYYVSAGPLETLHIATLGNAQIAGIDNLTGSIEKGKLADMIILDENPADNLKALRNISTVMKSGKIVKGKLKKNKEIEHLLDSIL